MGLDSDFYGFDLTKKIYKTVSAVPSSDSVTIEFEVNGWHTYDFENTTSWIRADEVKIEYRAPADKEENKNQNETEKSPNNDDETDEGMREENPGTGNNTQSEDNNKTVTPGPGEGGQNGTESGQDQEGDKGGKNDDERDLGDEDDDLIALGSSSGVLSSSGSEKGGEKNGSDGSILGLGIASFF